MPFADPQACPDCRGVIAGETACPHCGLDLTSAEVRELWQTLLRADELLAQASLRRVSSAPTPPLQQAPVQQAPVQQAPPQPAPVQQAPPMFQPYPQAPPTPQAPRKERSWSVGTILLVLGAFGLIVAGLIFVTRSWEDIGLAGKSVILLAVTAVMAALGIWVTRRPLRASAEAVWTVFLALLTLDFFAARHEDLLSLRSIDIAWAWVLWGVVALGLSLLLAVWARPLVKADLIAPAIAGGFAITIAGIGAGAVTDEIDFGWRAIVAGVVAGLLALSTRPAKLRPMTLVARIVFAGFFVTAYVSALVELLNHPSLDDMFRGGHGIPLVLMAVASLVVAALVAPVRVAGVALAVLAVTVLVVTPASEGWDPEAVWLAVAALAAILVVAVGHGTNDWMRGARLGATPVVAGIVLLHLGLLLDVMGTIGEVLDRSWELSWDTRLNAASVQDYRAWAVPPILVALLVVAWFVTRWPELAKLRAHATTVLAGAAALGVVDAVVTARFPVWGAALALIALASALYLARVKGLVAHAGPIAAVVVLLASALAAASQGVSAATWLAGAVVLAAFAAAQGSVPLRVAFAVGAVVLDLAGDAAVVELFDLDSSVTALVVLLAALGLVATAGTQLREQPVRLGVEATAGLIGLIALVSYGSSGELSVRWTIVGVALIALSAVVADRRWYVWPGAASLVVAYVLLIIDSGFSFVEAYTLPLGAVALAVGFQLARRRPEATTWVLLGPGLAIAMLPSLPQALAAPTELRALLLGVGALVVLLLGIRLGWQAPFVSGAGILILLLLFNIGPYANAAPRVILIAGVSAILLGVGITWEDRVRDGRKVVGYVRSMR